MVPRQRKLYNFNAPDGFLINAVLVSGEFKNTKELYNSPIVLIVHGVLGHFLARGTPRLLPNALVERGISSLSINTRLAFTGQIFGGGIFDDSVLDIDAAVDALTEEGFKKIYVLGWSLGANITVYYAVRGAHKNVKGIILEGCSSSLPLSHKRRLDKWRQHPVLRAHIRDREEGAQARPVRDEERQDIRRVQGVGAFVRPVRLRDVLVQDVVVHEEPGGAEREDERDNRGR